MATIMTLLCGDCDLPIIKLHGLRMLAPAILEHIPLSSADSAMVARNVNRDRKWSGTFASRTKAARAITLRDRIEDAPFWDGVEAVSNRAGSTNGSSARRCRQLLTIAEVVINAYFRYFPSPWCRRFSRSAPLIRSAARTADRSSTLAAPGHTRPSLPLSPVPPPRRRAPARRTLLRRKAGSP